MALRSKYMDIIIIGENTNGIATSDLQAWLDDATYVLEQVVGVEIIPLPPKQSQLPVVQQWWDYIEYYYSFVLRI